MLHYERRTVNDYSVGVGNAIKYKRGNLIVIDEAKRSETKWHSGRDTNVPPLELWVVCTQTG